MCRYGASVLSVVAIAGIAGFTAFRAPSIEGVWKTVEVRTTGPGGRTITDVQPSIDIVTARHYSRVEIHAAGPRPNVADAAKATADELRQAWGPVIAEAGSYQISANTIAMRPVVAKNQSAMSAGAVFTYGYRLAGDTLWVTPQRDLRGAVVNPPTIKLVRVE